MNPKIFLATNSSEEFWDRKRKIVFLQEGCKLFSRKSFWENLDHETFHYCLDTEDKIQTALGVYRGVYDNSMKALSKVLNQYHGIDKEQKYYKFLLGVWLEVFIKQLYEKYVVLKEFQKSFPEFETFFLSKDQHNISLDLKDFYNKLNTDEYVLQIYSQILEFLGYRFPYKKLKNPLVHPSLYIANRVWENKDNEYSHCRVTRGILRRVIGFFSATHAQLNRALGRRSFVITSPYCSKKNMALFIIKNRFRYVLDEFLCPVKIPVKLDLQARDSFRVHLGDTEFENLLSKLLFKHLPFAYIEGFKDVRNAASRLGIRKGGVYFTGIGNQSNLVYSFFIAEHHRDIIFLMHQHGAGYRMSSDDTVERIETELADRFYTWGWEGEKCRVLPHPKICNPCRDRTAGTRMVLVLEDRERYTYRWGAQGAAFFGKYISPLFDFLDNIREDIDIDIRPHVHDRGWEVPSRIESRYRGRNLKILTGEFKSAICNAKICVYANPYGTAFLETLAKGSIPTIAFFDPGLQQIREGAKEYMDGLIRAEIMHPCPKQAAEKLNKVFDGVEAWWNKPFVQEARSRFVRQFARTSENWQLEWSKEFDEVLEKGV